MPEESDKERELEEEMMRMMQEEAGGGEEDAESSLEAEMMREMMTEGEGGEGGDDSLEAEMMRAMMEEAGASEETAQVALRQGRGGALAGRGQANTERLLDIRLSISIELGRTEVPISTVLEWAEGSLIELTKVSGEAVDVLINDRIFARGEVVTIAENFGVRLTEILA